MVGVVLGLVTALAMVVLLSTRASSATEPELAGVAWLADWFGYDPARGVGRDGVPFPRGRPFPVGPQHTFAGERP